MFDATFFFEFNKLCFEFLPFFVFSVFLLFCVVFFSDSHGMNMNGITISFDNSSRDIATSSIFLNQY